MQGLGFGVWGSFDIELPLVPRFMCYLLGVLVRVFPFPNDSLTAHTCTA